MELSPLILIAFFGITLSLMVGAILIFYPIVQRVSHPNLFLGILFFLYAFITGIRLLHVSGYIIEYPFFFFSSLIAMALTVPAPYLYLQKIVRRQKPTWQDIKLFLPSVLIFLNFLPFYLRSNEEKQALLMHRILEGGVGWIFKPHLLLSSDTIQLVLFVFIFLSYALMVRVLYRIYRISNETFWNENGHWFRWFILFMVIQTIFILPLPVFYISFSLHHWWNSSIVLMSSAAILTALYLVVNPGILYGLQGLLVNDTEQNKPEDSRVDVPELGTGDANEDVQGYSYLSESQVKLAAQKISDLFENEKPFLKKGYSLESLAADTGLPERWVSAYINSCLQLHFFDLINKARVEYIARHLSTDFLRQMTIEAIGESVGFNNRTSFVNAVKKHAGATPHQYIQTIIAQRAGKENL